MSLSDSQACGDLLQNGSDALHRNKDFLGFFMPYRQMSTARRTLRINVEDPDLPFTDQTDLLRCATARLLHQRTTVLLGTPSTSRSDCGMAQSYRPTGTTVEPWQATRAECKGERCSSARLKMRGCGVPPRRRPTTLGTLSACVLS